MNEKITVDRSENEWFPYIIIYAYKSTQLKNHLR